MDDFQAPDHCQRPFTRNGVAVRTSGFHQYHTYHHHHHHHHHQKQYHDHDHDYNDNDQGVVAGSTDASASSPKYGGKPCKPQVDHYGHDGDDGDDDDDDDDHCNGDDDDDHCNGDVDEGNNNDDNYMYHDDIYCGDFDIFATPSGRSIQYIYDDDYIDDDD